LSTQAGLYSGPADRFVEREILHAFFD
jgi:hypothetical protein